VERSEQRGNNGESSLMFPHPAASEADWLREVDVLVELGNIEIKDDIYASEVKYMRRVDLEFHGVHV
jgi:hypothetical protein